jgi:hypothetical protein
MQRRYVDTTLLQPVAVLCDTGVALALLAAELSALFEAAELCICEQQHDELWLAHFMWFLYI